MAKQSKDTIALQALWRLALEKGEYRIKFTNKSDCARVRFALYNAVRLVREGKLKDPELEQAIQECSVSIEGLEVVIRNKLESSAIKTIMQQIEADAAHHLDKSPLTPQEQEIAESQKRFLERMARETSTPSETSDEAPATATPGTRVTPYYTR